MISPKHSTQINIVIILLLASFHCTASPYCNSRSYLWQSWCLFSSQLIEMPQARRNMSSTTPILDTYCGFAEDINAVISQLSYNLFLRSPLQSDTSKNATHGTVMLNESLQGFSPTIRNKYGAKGQPCLNPQQFSKTPGGVSFRHANEVTLWKSIQQVEEAFTKAISCILEKHSQPTLS